MKPEKQIQVTITGWYNEIVTLPENKVLLYIKRIEANKRKEISNLPDNEVHRNYTQKDKHGNDLPVEKWRRNLIVPVNPDAFALRVCFATV